MATSRPSFMRARCTCPMEAAAKGRSSKYSSLSLQLGPRSLLRVFWRERPGRDGQPSPAPPGRPRSSSARRGRPGAAHARHRPPHRHLFQGHEVRALPHPLEDLGQVGVDESIVWKAPEKADCRGLAPGRSAGREQRGHRTHPARAASREVLLCPHTRAQARGRQPWQHVPLAHRRTTASEEQTLTWVCALGALAGDGAPAPHPSPTRHRVSLGSRALTTGRVAL